VTDVSKELARQVVEPVMTDETSGKGGLEGG
jgi:hypothetical protein